jgi:hypothetical protein
MSKVKYILLAFILVFIFNFSSAYSIVMVLLNGKIIDKSTGKPVATKVKFIEKSGKVHQSNSNSIDGIFQQVMPAGIEYSVIIEGWIPEEKLRKLSVPNYQEYTEFGFEYNVDKIDVGTILASGSIFQSNSSEIKSEFEPLFDYIKEVNKSKKGLIFDAKISTADSYFAPKTISEKYVVKGKSKTRKVTLTTETQLTKLIDDRQTKLIVKFENMGINSKNLNFTPELVIKKPKPNSKVKSKSKTLSVEEIFSNNLTIKIERIINL